MAKDLDQMQYYYDSHPTEEDLMGETAWHASLIRYLYAVLAWLFRGQVCAIYDDLSFYQTRNHQEYPVAPDLAVIKGIPYRYTSNWVLPNGDPPPRSSSKSSPKKPGRRMSTRNPAPIPAWVSSNTLPMIPMSLRCGAGTYHD